MELQYIQRSSGHKSSTLTKQLQDLEHDPSAGLVGEKPSKAGFTSCVEIVRILHYA